MKFLKVFCVVGLSMAVGVLLALLGSVLIVRLEHVDNAKIWEMQAGRGPWFLGWVLLPQHWSRILCTELQTAFSEILSIPKQGF